MNPNIVFLDIDGTLFDAVVKVPQSAIDAIQKARACGHKVCICTGRPRMDVGDDIRSIGFDGYIFSSGCVIEVNQELIYQKTMPYDVLSMIIPILEKQHIGFNLEGIKQSYLNEQAMELFAELFMKEQDINSEMARHMMKANQMISFQDFVLSKAHNIVKISVFSNNLDDFEQLLNDLPDNIKFTVHPFGHSDVYNGELSLSDVHKATGIDHILSYFKHPLEHTIGIGDGMNDIEMIKHCQIGICMGNGSEELKRYSDDICPTIHEDGLAYALCKHLHLNE